MHAAPTVRLGCTDCHGGDAAVRKAGARRLDATTEAASEGRT